MRPPLLTALLAFCGVLSVYPATVWAFAAVFDMIDDRWHLLLSHSVFTIPLALALAALILTIHGLRINALFQEEAVEEFNEIREREIAAAGAMAAATVDSAPAGAPGMPSAPGVPAAASVSASASPRTAEDPRRRGNTSTGKRLRRRAQAMAARKIRRQTGFY